MNATQGFAQGFDVRRSITLGLAVALAAPVIALAQAWPAKPVRLIVSFPAGGTTDGAARLVANALEGRLKQAIVVENRVGANQVIAVDAVEKSAPDGYTFLVSASSVFAENLLNKDVTINPLKNLTPAAKFSGAGLFLLVPSSFPPKNLAEFIAWVKANPGKLNWASVSGTNTGQPETEEFRLKNGLENVVFVAYKGGTAGAQAIAANEAHIFGGSPVDALPHIKSGRARALAYTDSQRSTLIPDVPTAVEQGYDLVTGFSFWFLAPAGTPEAIVQRMNTEINDYMKTPAATERFTQMGLQTYTTNTVPQLRAEMQKIVGTVEDLLKKGVKLR